MSPARPDPADAEAPAGDRAPRILVVDADDRTRESVVGILGIRHRYDVVGSASTIAEALGFVGSTDPDVVILDPRLPDAADGLALIRRIRSVRPGVAILAVGWAPELERDTIAAGADGFVRKTFKPGDLSSAIARCMGRGALPPVGSNGSHLAAVDAAVDPAIDPASRPVPARGTGLIL
jgi:DNA-binding NarL/FixJ family response regulator